MNYYIWYVRNIRNTWKKKVNKNTSTVTVKKTKKKYERERWEKKVRITFEINLVPHERETCQHIHSVMALSVLYLPTYTNVQCSSEKYQFYTAVFFQISSSTNVDKFVVTMNRGNLCCRGSNLYSVFLNFVKRNENIWFILGRIRESDKEITILRQVLSLTLLLVGTYYQINDSRNPEIFLKSFSRRTSSQRDIFSSEKIPNITYNIPKAIYPNALLTNGQCLERTKTFSESPHELNLILVHRSPKPTASFSDRVINTRTHLEEVREDRVRHDSSLPWQSGLVRCIPVQSFGISFFFQQSRTTAENGWDWR